ncbi:MAG: nucleotide exchange factor GrpE [Oculatellaceae cyanobacterium Prado106]|nr:nucleotide exchange factor GrpE [Oculatellaceae cyanobacterium Prado106]
MSAEANLQTENLDPQATPVAAEVVAPEGTEEEFTLDPEGEPFDLNPDSAASTDGQASSAEIKELTQTVEALKAQVEEKSNQAEDLSNQYKRLAADFDNYRRRTQKEKEETEVQVKCTTIGELLSVVDNFERARSQIKPQSDAEMNIHKSYQGIYKQLVDSLKRIGVSPMRAEGQEFDPNLHEAVMREPTSEFAEGVVMEELVRGYTLGDRVLRHALVKVAAAPEDAEDSSSESSTEA